MKIYAYHVSCPKAFSIWETGEYDRLFTEEQSTYYSDRNYQEFRILLGIIQVHLYDDIAGALRVLARGSHHETEELFFAKKATFTIEEAAVMLGMPVIKAKEQLKRNKKGYVCGKDILEISLKSEVKSDTSNA